jgi:uncharacterized protein YfaQ (DUF2300 family)
MKKPDSWVAETRETWRQAKRRFTPAQSAAVPDNSQQCRRIPYRGTWLRATADIPRGLLIDKRVCPM